MGLGPHRYPTGIRPPTRKTVEDIQHIVTSGTSLATIDECARGEHENEPDSECRNVIGRRQTMQRHNSQ
jgi:hypothetical protein